MKIPLPKFRLPWFRLPKIGVPKIGLPKIAPKGRTLVIGAGALALLVSGGLAWVFLKPMLAAQKKPAEQMAAKAPEKPPEAPKKVEAGAEAPKAGEARPEAPKTPENSGAKAEAATAKPEATAEKPAEKPEKAEGGEKAATAAPLPLSPPSEPERQIRRLQDIQERVAAGDSASFAEMPRLLRLIGEKYVALPPETWSQKKNARALVLYLLSGGGSAVGRRILNQHKFAASEAPLAKAAIAYLEGVEGPDRDMLLSLDPRALDLDLGAQVAFVQSILLTNVDRQKAVASLDMARLLAPGGLVEEAALRREVALLSETSQFDKFADLARQYWERFRRSPYAGNFLRQFMLSASRISLKIKVPEWAELDQFISSLTPQTQHKLYLAMAQTAAAGGNFDFADMAARRALDLSAANSLERQRALLYRAAAEVGGADLAHGPQLLGEVERAKLPVGDQPLYDAVATASARIFRTPEQQFRAEPPGAADDVDASLARAESNVKEADAIMDSVRKSMERKTR